MMAPQKKTHLPPHLSHADKYWELVRKTLNDIFSKSPSDADLLEYDVYNMPLAQQELFYHAEALTIASEIADQEPTSSQIDRYKHLRAGIFGLS